MLLGLEKKDLALELIVSTRVVDVETWPLVWGWRGVAFESVGAVRLGKQYPNPRYQQVVRYMRVASRPKPKKMKIMKPDATGVQRSKKTTP
jgi:hypothetical protein